MIFMVIFIIFICFLTIHTLWCWWSCILVLGMSLLACFNDWGCSLELIGMKNPVRSFWWWSLLHFIYLDSSRVQHVCIYGSECVTNVDMSLREGAQESNEPALALLLYLHTVVQALSIHTNHKQTVKLRNIMWVWTCICSQSNVVLTSILLFVCNIDSGSW